MTKNFSEQIKSIIGAADDKELVDAYVAEVGHGERDSAIAALALAELSSRHPNRRKAFDEGASAAEAFLK